MLQIVRARVCVYFIRTQWRFMMICSMFTVAMNSTNVIQTMRIHRTHMHTINSHRQTFEIILFAKKVSVWKMTRFLMATSGYLLSNQNRTSSVIGEYCANTQIYNTYTMDDESFRFSWCCFKTRIEINRLLSRYSS